MKSLILDFDDTLVTTAVDRKPLLEEHLRRWGATDDDILELTARWGLPFPKLVGHVVPIEQLKAFVDDYLTGMAVSPPLACSGSGALLDWAQERCIPVVIVSSSLSELIRADLRQLGFDSQVDAIFGAAETRHHKPDPRTLDVVASYLASVNRGTLADAIYVGDGERDWMMARSRMPFRAVVTGTVSREKFIDLGVPAEAVFDDLTKILESFAGSPPG